MMWCVCSFFYDLPNFTYLSISSRRSFSFSAFLSRRFWAFETLFSLISTSSRPSVTVSTCASGVSDLDFSLALVWSASSFSSLSCFSLSSNSSLAISSVVSFFFFLSPLLADFFRTCILAWNHECKFQS